MRVLLLTLLAATALGGCTAVQESLSPHGELLSPCVCAEDAIPINADKEGAHA